VEVAAAEQTVDIVIVLMAGLVDMLQIMILGLEQPLVLLVVILSLLVDIGDVAAVAVMVGLLLSMGLMVVLARLLVAVAVVVAHPAVETVTEEATVEPVVPAWCY
jgi:uncharacterized membrane protein YkgB